jgi:hypothetical protein
MVLVGVDKTCEDLFFFIVEAVFKEVRWDYFLRFFNVRMA